jgi:hypothetical protein
MLAQRINAQKAIITSGLVGRFISGSSNGRDFYPSSLDYSVVGDPATIQHPHCTGLTVGATNRTEVIDGYLTQAHSVITVAFWFRPVSVTNWHVCLNMRSDTAYGWYFFSSGASGSYAFRFTGINNYIGGGYTISNNTPRHIAGSFDKNTGNYAFYDNGLLVSSGQVATWSYIVPSNGNLLIGTGSTTYSFSDIRVYNRVLAKDEISLIYGGQG